MNELCQIIKNMVVPNFINMETAIITYDRNADCCGAPAVYTILLRFPKLYRRCRKPAPILINGCIMFFCCINILMS